MRFSHNLNNEIYREGGFSASENQRRQAGCLLVGKELKFLEVANPVGFLEFITELTKRTEKKKGNSLRSPCTLR
jgi:hypothetical protein